MWISMKINAVSSNQRAEHGEVTLSSSDNWEADASQTVRNVNTYLPYGYSSVAPAGEEVLLLPAADGVVSLGSKAKAGNEEAGEIRLCSKGGAVIELKNDGSIILNHSVIIDKRGRVTGWQQS